MPARISVCRREPNLDASKPAPAQLELVFGRIKATVFRAGISAPRAAAIHSAGIVVSCTVTPNPQLYSYTSPLLTVPLDLRDCRQAVQETDLLDVHLENLTRSQVPYSQS